MRRLSIPFAIVLALVLLAALATVFAEAGPVPVIYCNDGAPDDIMTLEYLLNNPGIDVKGVVLCNGEIHPRVVAPKFLSALETWGQGGIPVVVGYTRALDPHPHQFPAPWRQGADGMWGLVLPPPKGRISSESGSSFIARVVKETPGTVILITGPEADLALALRSDPSLAEKIERVVVMGGAFGVAGNIHEDWPPEKNTVSEWNIWVDAKAAAEVFASGARLSVVPLDAAGAVYADRNYISAIADAGRPGPAAAARLYLGIMQGRWQDRILIWDVLAGVAILHPEYFDWADKEVKVITKAGPEQGRTVAGGASDRSRYAAGAHEGALLKHVRDVLLGN